MAWTEERVALLTKLWSEGLSASQIARQLGDVTRNAVIGKVHRLGLSGRATPSRAERPRMPARRKRAPKPILIIPETVKEARLPDGNFVTVPTLRDGMCKWPYGDPSRSDFHFCGQAAHGGPYCRAHAAVAYQPLSARRSRPAAQPRPAPVVLPREAPAAAPPPAQPAAEPAVSMERPIAEPKRATG